MNQVSRQDIQSIVDVARNRIIERVVCRQDMLVLHDAMKTIMSAQQQQQLLLRQAEQQRVVFTRRAEAVESRLSTIEHEIRTTQVLIARMLDRMATQRIQQVALPAQPERQPETSHVYKPA